MSDSLSGRQVPSPPNDYKALFAIARLNASRTIRAMNDCVDLAGGESVMRLVKADGASAPKPRQPEK